MFCIQPPRPLIGRRARPWLIITEGGGGGTEVHNVGLRYIKLFKPLTFAAFPSPSLLVADYTFNANILIDVRMNLVQGNLSEK